jgi:glycosyltransferase involved in cell wall biosynthesis
MIPDAKITVIPNGVDAERFAALPLLNDRPAEPVILTSGGVKVRKGTLQLIQAVARVREQIPDVRCIVIGTLDAEPVYVEQVRAEIIRLQLQNHVELTGFVDQQTLDNWYGRARLFVLPSINASWKFEGFGLVHLEASAAGLPVIGTHGCGAADAVTDEVTGLLVSQEGIAEELPRAILSILRNPERAQAMGAAGREKAKQQTWDHAASQVLQAYQNQSGR